MTSLAWLIPAALVLGGLGLAAFLWSLKSGQYEDLDGAAWRALQDRSPADAAKAAAARSDTTDQTTAPVAPSKTVNRADGD